MKRELLVQFLKDTDVLNSLTTKTDALECGYFGEGWYVIGAQRPVEFRLSIISGPFISEIVAHKAKKRFEDERCLLSQRCDMLGKEESITWLEDPTQHRYLRETNALCSFKQKWSRRNFNPSGRIVGYAVLRKQARYNVRRGFFERRVWWLAPHDPYKEGGAPCEAVVPSSIEPGMPSVDGWEEPQTAHEPAIP